MKTKLYIFIVICIALTIPSAVLAVSFSNIMTFGDSLSDNGPDDGYGSIRLSNGPVWVEYLADAEHLNCGLDDRAVSGAPSYDVLDNQIQPYLTNNIPTPEMLFTLSVGGNDFRLAGDTEPQTVVDNAMANITASLNGLASAGGRHFIVSNLWVPLYVDPIEGEFMVNMFNTSLLETLNNFENTFEAENSTDIDIYRLDLYSILADVKADPTSFGFTNATDPAPDSGPYEGYVFYDDTHPTTAFHNLLGDSALEMVAPIPIPAPIWLLGSGIIGIVGFRRKFKKV